MKKISESKESICELSINDIEPFIYNPYKVIDNEEMKELVESILENGILTPLMVRRLENSSDKYELISGHRRLFAAKKAGLEKVPAFVYEISRDEAAVMVVDSNLHREHILPSEKAFAYKMKYDAMKHQGTSRQLGAKLRTDQEIANDASDSARQIQRYIRLTNLIPDILKLVDEGRIALTPAVELSYLNSHEQEVLNEIMSCDELTPSLSQAQRLRKLSEDYTLTDSGISQIMSEIKGNQKEYVRVPTDSIRKYFTRDTTVKQMEQTIVKAMEFYNKYLERQRNDRDAR